MLVILKFPNDALTKKFEIKILITKKLLNTTNEETLIIKVVYNEARLIIYNLRTFFYVFLFFKLHNYYNPN